MAENVSELKTVLIDQMEDMLHAENQLTKLLGKAAKAAHSPQLRQLFLDHLAQTRGHSERLQQGLGLLGVKAKAKTCKGMLGLVDEAEQGISEGKDLEPAAADLNLIIGAQKIEHYEISGYGSLRTVAERIGESRVARLLAENQAEERRTDELLTEAARPLFAKAA